MTKARLLACPGCARHVRVSEHACLFCGLVLPESFRDAPVVPPPPTRMSRSGLFAYRARALAASTAALVTASCGGTLDASSSDAGSDVYVGGDASTSADASLGDSSPGDDAIATLYGFPVGDGSFFPDASQDAGSDATTGADSAYDGAPPPDASEPDAVVLPPYGIAPAYGLPNP
jgi:hypothetical protein